MAEPVANCPIIPEVKQRYRMMDRKLNVRTCKDGVTFTVRLQPSSRQNAVVGEYAGALKISVTTAPEKGKANAALLRLLAEYLDVPVDRLQILAGEKSRLKTILVRGATEQEISARLTSLLHQED